MKKRIGVRITYELLAEALELKGCSILRIINDREEQSMESILLHLSVDGGYPTPEGCPITHIPYYELQERLKEPK